MPHYNRTNDLHVHEKCKAYLLDYFCEWKLRSTEWKRKSAYLQSLCYFGAKTASRVQWIVTPSGLQTPVWKRGKFNQKDWFELWFRLAKRQQGRASFQILTNCKNEKRQESKTSLQLFSCEITMKELYLYKNYSTLQLFVFFVFILRNFLPFKFLFPSQIGIKICLR